MSAAPTPGRVEILSAEDLGRTLNRLASQVLEGVADSRQLVLLGIPTRGVALAQVLAQKLEQLCGHPVDQGSLDPTFHRDDLDRVGIRLPAFIGLHETGTMPESTQLWIFEEEE